MPPSRLDGAAYADPRVPFLDPPLSASTLALPKESKHITVSRALGLRTGSVRGSIYNLFSSVLGAGVLGLPHAVAAWGLVPGLCLVVPFALISLYTLRLLGWSAELTGAKSYRQLAELTLGDRMPAMQRLVSVAIFFNTFGSLVVYLIVLGELIPSFAATFLEAAGGDVGAPPAAMRPLLFAPAVIVGMGVAFGLPLSLLRDLSMLRYTSFLSMGSILFLGVVLAFRCAQGVLADDAAAAVARDALGMRPTGSLAKLLGGLPTFIYAFSCHFNFFSAVEALKRRTRPAVLQVQSYAIALSLFTYVLIVAAVLLSYAARTETDFLTNLPTSDRWFTAAKLLYTLVLIAAYPLNCHPCRAALLEMAGAYGRSERARDGSTLVLVLTSITLAIVCPNIAVALSLVGGTATSSLLYVFPALFFLAATRDEPTGHAQLLEAARRARADALEDSLGDAEHDAYVSGLDPRTLIDNPELARQGSAFAGGRCAGLVRMAEHRLACRALIGLGAFAWFCSGLALVA